MSQQVPERDLAAIIGLEVHVQLETDTKIFCGCSTDTGNAEPNSHTCPVCLGLPGALPVLNEGAVEAAVKLGKAIDADIPERTRFHRKNYFYPDLPKGFQITQYDAPVCQDGRLDVAVEDERRTIGIERAHLEEDPGSLQHVGGSIDTADYTLVDYNRAGTPLMEIVTRPDFRDADEVRSFLAKLTDVLEYLGIFDAERDGSLRVDANISMVDAQEMDAGGEVSTEVLESANRTEVKNISSHKAAEKALAYEITRQRNQIQRGREVEQETRHWDEARGITVSMRSKEEEKDYRYFREADIPPLEVSDWKERIPIPELPDARRERFREEYDLGAETASKLTSRKAVADLFEEMADEYDAGLAATWVADNILGELNYRDLDVSDVEDRIGEFERLIELVATDEITSKNAREVVLRKMLDENLSPDRIVEAENLGKADFSVAEQAAEDAMIEYLESIDDYFSGEDQALNFLVGQVMNKTEGGADPEVVNKTLRDRLARDLPTEWENLSDRRKEVIALICHFTPTQAFSRAELNHKLREEYPQEYFDGLAVTTSILNKISEEDNYLVKVEQGGHGLLIQDINSTEGTEVVSPTKQNLKEITQQVLARNGLDLDEEEMDWSDISEVVNTVNSVVGEQTLLLRRGPNRYKLRNDFRNKLVHNSELSPMVERHLPAPP